MNSHNRSQTLLVAFNRIGDLTMSTPLLRAIAAGSELSILTRPFGPALLGNQPYIKEVFGLPYPNRGNSGLGKLVLGGHRRALGRRLQQCDFDEVLIYETERDVIRDWLETLFPGRVREMRRREAEDIHSVDLYRQAAESLGYDDRAFDPVPRLDIGDESLAEALPLVDGLGRRVVGVQTGSQRTHARRFPRPRPNLKSLSDQQWGLVVGGILDRGAEAVAFHGAPNEAELVDALIAGFPGPVRARCHNLARDVGLDLLPAVLSTHRALVSVDTGTAHVAAAVGCPVLVLFGPTDPAVFAPRGHGPVEVLLGRASCQFCHGSRLYKTCRDNRCLNRLEADELLGGWDRLRGTIEALEATPSTD